MKPIDQCTALAVELNNFAEMLPYMAHLKDEKASVPVASLEKLRKDSADLVNALLKSRLPIGRSEAEIKAELHWAAWHTTEMHPEEVLCLIANEFQWKMP